MYSDITCMVSYHQSYCTGFGFFPFENDANHGQFLRLQRFVHGFDGRDVQVLARLHVHSLAEILFVRLRLRQVTVIYRITSLMLTKLTFTFLYGSWKGVGFVVLRI